MVGVVLKDPVFYRRTTSTDTHVNAWKMNMTGRALSGIRPHIEFNKKYANFHIAIATEHMRGKTNVTPAPRRRLPTVVPRADTLPPGALRLRQSLKTITR